MGGSRRYASSGRTFAISVAWIVGLVISYILIADWQSLPRIVSSAFGS